MDALSLEKYRREFSRIRQHSHKELGAAPHKPILLLAVLDEIERGTISENRIVLTPSLMMTFHDYWQQFVDPSRPTPRIAYPFRRLHSSGFWDFVRGGRIVLPEDRDYSVRQLQDGFDGVRLAPDLWELLTDRRAIGALRQQLLSTYFPGRVVRRPQMEDLLLRGAERLKAEAQAKFRLKQVRESETDWYYVRHSLFAPVIKGLYRESCAVCGLSARLPNGANLLEAAHIRKFADFHCDHVCNGIALCRNHHAGFDRGMFSLTDDYRVMVNPRLENPTGFVLDGTLILLPENPSHYPDLDAIREHRNRMRRE